MSAGVTSTLNAFINQVLLRTSSLIPYAFVSWIFSDINVNVAIRRRSSAPSPLGLEKP